MNTHAPFVFVRRYFLPRGSRRGKPLLEGRQWFPGYRCIQHIRVEVGFIRPANGAQFRIEPYPREVLALLERSKHTHDINQCGDIHFTCNTILEPNPETIATEGANSFHMFVIAAAAVIC